MTADALSVREAGEIDAARWDAYVGASPEATFFHFYGWRRVIEGAYGHGACYLMATRGARVVGVLPLIDVASPLFGRNLISTAFTVGGGIAADDVETRKLLADTAFEAGRRRRVGYVELRSHSAALDGWSVKSGVYAGFEKAIPTEESAALNAIPRRRRAEVRKGIDALAAGELGISADADWGEFYALYARAMRDHGTPVYPRAFLAGLMMEFGDRIDTLVVSAKGEPLLGLLSFYFRDRIMPYYIGGKADARSFRATDLALWTQIRRAAERGACVVDLGRSKYGSGSFAYKSH
ncbi:MAG: FemAB family XrtA/PEP-CTERM system-associated protein, partial [Parvularculaceae bacterium]